MAGGSLVKVYSAKSRKYRAKKGPATAKKALKEVRKLSRRLAPEVKWVDTNRANAAIPLSTALPGSSPDTTLSNIAEGDTQNNREGIKVKCKSIQLKGQCFWNATSGASQGVKIMIVRYHSNRGLAMDLDAILDDQGPTISGNTDYTQAMINPFTYKQDGYTILASKNITLDQYHPYKTFSLSYYKPFVIEYNGASANVANTESNSVGVYFMSNQATANAPTGNYFARLKFTD